MKIADDKNVGNESGLKKFVSSTAGKLAIGGGVLAIVLVVCAVAFFGGDKGGDDVQQGTNVGGDKEAGEVVSLVQNSERLDFVESLGIEVDVDADMTEEEVEQKLRETITVNNNVISKTYGEWVSSKQQLDEEWVKKNILGQLDGFDSWINDWMLGWRLHCERTFGGFDPKDWTAEKEEYDRLLEMMDTGKFVGVNTGRDTLEKQAAQIRYVVATRSVWSRNFVSEKKEYYDVLHNWFAQGRPHPKTIDTIILQDLKDRPVYDNVRIGYLKATILQNDGTIYECYLSPINGFTYGNGDHSDDEWLICDFYQVDSSGNAVGILQEAVESYEQEE